MKKGQRVSERIVAVVVTHKRAELLAESLKVLAAQDRPVDHLVVVDNADEAVVADLVAGQPIPTTHIGSKRNLSAGRAVSRSVCCTHSHWEPTGYGAPTTTAARTVRRCSRHYSRVRETPWARRGVAGGRPHRRPRHPRLPAARGLVWRRKRSELFADDGRRDDDLLPGIASLFNGHCSRHMPWKWSACPISGCSSAATRWRSIAACNDRA